MLLLSCYRRTAFQGDSGAKKAITRSGTGQDPLKSEWKAPTSSPSRPTTARKTPDEVEYPRPMRERRVAGDLKMCISQYESRLCTDDGKLTKGRKTVGTISQAYAVVRVC